MVNRVVFYMFFTLALAACGDNHDRVRELAQVQGKEAADRQVEAEVQERDARAQKLEQDLSQRQKLYDSLAGDYEAIYETSSFVFDVHLRLRSSLPSYSPPDRLKTPEEIVIDLNNLFLTAQVSFYESDRFVFSCVYEHVRPDVKEARFQLISEECRRSFDLRAVDEAAEDFSPQTPTGEKILAGKLDQVLELVGETTPNYDSRLKEVRFIRI